MYWHEPIVVVEASVSLPFPSEPGVVPPASSPTGFVVTPAS